MGACFLSPRRCLQDPLSWATTVVAQSAMLLATQRNLLVVSKSFPFSFSFGELT